MRYTKIKRSDNMKQWLLNLGQSAANRILPFILILLIGLIVIRIVLAIINKAMARSHMEKAAHGLIKSVIRTVLYLLLGLIAASSLGIDVTGIIALASVFTLALSLSVQNALTNLIGGFTLLYTKPFKSGDYVEIAGQSGTVSEIGMSYTKLITPDNKIIHIPNSAVVSADITNYTVTGYRRMDIAVTASYDAPTETVLAALRQAANVPNVLTDPAPFFALTGYGDHGVQYVVRLWATNEHYWDVNFAVLSRIRECFADQGVEMTYPHLNIHVNQ